MLARRLVNQARGRMVARRNKSVWESGNDVKTKRAKYYTNHTQGAGDPTYLKEPSDKIVAGAMCALCALGMINIGSGLYSMSFGVNKV